MCLPISNERRKEFLLTSCIVQLFEWESVLEDKIWKEMIHDPTLSSLADVLIFTTKDRVSRAKLEVYFDFRWKFVRNNALLRFLDRLNLRISSSTLRWTTRWALIELKHFLEFLKSHKWSWSTETDAKFERMFRTTSYVLSSDLGGVFRHCLEMYFRPIWKSRQGI